MENSLELQKNRILDHLSQIYSQDTITLDEYEALTERVTALNHPGDLNALLREIPGLPVPYQRSAHPVTTNSPDSQTSIAIFSGTDVTGRFNAPRNHHAIAVFGGVDIDLRDAIIPQEGMTIHAFAAFGGVDVIIPEDINLEISGIGIFGGFSGKRHHSEDPNAPTVRIDGLAIFGGVDVKIRNKK